jgi:hypothetical protein
MDAQRLFKSFLARNMRTASRNVWFLRVRLLIKSFSIGFDKYESLIRVVARRTCFEP